MIVGLFSYPNPNNKDRYDLSEEELVALLQKAYDNGFQHAKEIYDNNNIQITTSATWRNGYENYI